jgi:hypothetical protein
MTLKIEKYADGDGTTIRLMGRMQTEHLEELEKQIRESGPVLILDLDEVTLVDVEIVRFLGTCEARGATLLNCSPFIRDWIGKERDLKEWEKNRCLRNWKERLLSLSAARAVLALQSLNVWPRTEHTWPSRTRRTPARLPPSDRNFNSRPAESENRWRQNQGEPK